MFGSLSSRWLTTVLLPVLVLNAGFSLVLEAQETRFLRYPHVSNDGRLTFSYHGDIWLTEADGSRPQRLTAHVARDTIPRFSPDGKQIAFTSDRLGNSDVFVVPVTGGRPRQITHHTTGDTLQYWTPDGKGLLISSSRGHHPWGSPLYIAPLDGSLPTPLPMDRAAAGMLSQDGKFVAFNRRGFTYWRKGYRGNNNTDIWLQNVETMAFRKLTDLDLKNYQQHTQDAFPMWGADGHIYFLSERADIFNIFRISPDGGQPEQVTHHQVDGVQYPSISPDGTTIVYENEFALWRLQIPAGKPERVAIDLRFDTRDNLVAVHSSNNNAEAFSPAPDASQVAVAFRGELFLVPHDPKLGEKSQVTDSPWRDRSPLYSPDGKYIAYISDQTHEEEIWLYEVASGKHRQATQQESLKSSLTWSPDSQHLAFVALNKLFMLDVSTDKLTELAHNPEGGFRIYGFSVDGQYLVYTRSNADLVSEVYVFHIADRQEFNLTDSLFSESNGALTNDGKHLVFTSNRSGDSHVYIVPLAKQTFDPNDPLQRRRLLEESRAASKSKGSSGKPPADSPSSPPADPAEGEADPKTDGAETQDPAEEKPATDADSQPDKEKAEPVRLKIDLEGIQHRARQLTSGDAVRNFLLSQDGKQVYYVQGSALMVIGLDGEGGKKLADGAFGNLTLTADGKQFFFRRGSEVFSLPVGGGSPKRLEFSVRVMVNTEQEWEQIFEEAWRVMKYRFYDADMHGQDWNAVKAFYKPFLKYVGENQDLYDLCNQMIGELNASHTGVSGPASRNMPSLYSTRHLGFELETHGDYYRVHYIYPRGPADQEWVELKVGDYVLEIEGQAIRAGDNYYEILNRLLNEYVNLTVAAPGQAADADTQVLGTTRTVRLPSISSVNNLKYEAWVEQNRQWVDQWSNGKIGYLHIRSMNQPSLRKFETEINQFWNKNGMIIDIRYNGGGNIDQQLIDILERRPYEYWNFRDGGRARGRRPRQAIAGPQVMLINWRSASDSEVTPQAFRDLGLGRIVGNPTYGGVIATGSHSLINGASIRTPSSLVVTYDPTQPHNYGLNLENYGVPPDVWVENTPWDELNGFDRELRVAVDEAIKMLAEGTWQFGEKEGLPEPSSTTPLPDLSDWLHKD